MVIGPEPPCRRSAVIGLFLGVVLRRLAERAEDAGLDESLDVAVHRPAHLPQEPGLARRRRLFGRDPVELDRGHERTSRPREVLREPVVQIDLNDAVPRAPRVPIWIDDVQGEKVIVAGGFPDGSQANQHEGSSVLGERRLAHESGYGRGVRSTATESRYGLAGHLQVAYVFGMDPGRRRDRQVVRVLGLLKTLAGGGRPTVHEIAARFKTRRETVYRDLHTLEAIGYPIVGDDAGRLSRPRLAPEFRAASPPIPFTRKETAALVWAVKQSGGRQPFAAALSTAVVKLQALAPGREGRLSIALDGTVSGWDRGLKNYAVLEPTILRLVEAIVSRRHCRVAYQSPSRKTPRSFPYDPYRLLSVQGGLYCVGKVPAYANLVTLAIDRVRSLELTDEAFAVDPTFDPKRLEAEAFGVVWERPMTVVVRFRADQAPYVREREWHPTQKLRELRDGRVELTFRAGGAFEIMRWILGWGDAAEVVKPTRLRRELERVLVNASQNYRTGGSPE